MGDIIPQSSDDSRPFLHLDDTMLPEVKTWENDREYQILLKVKQNDSGKHGEGIFGASFEILSAEAVNGTLSDDQVDMKERMGGSDHE